MIIPFDLPQPLGWDSRNTLIFSGDGEKISCTVSDPDNCLRYGVDESSCVENNCLFMNGLCEPFSCFDTEERSVCDKHSECYWTDKYGQGCVERECFRYETDEECLADNNCILDEYCKEKPKAQFELTVTTS